jgi:hypothetical protein
MIKRIDEELIKTNEIKISVCPVPSNPRARQLGLYRLCNEDNKIVKKLLKYIYVKSRSQKRGYKGKI